MKAMRSMVAAGLTLVLGSACALDGAEFQNALPSEQSVTIQAPEGIDNALSLGERSEYYTMTRTMSRDVNGFVRGVLLLVQDIASNPPSKVEGDVLTWGPGAGDALDPNVYRLVATKLDEGVFDYSLEYRRKAAGDAGAFIVLLAGHSDTSSGANDGVGTLELHLDAIRDAEESGCGAGTLAVQYDTTGDGVSAPHHLAVQFAGFVACENPEAAPANATYYYDRLNDGSGNFQFSFAGDIHEGARSPVALETLVIRSRWNAAGEGRSDVKIDGGDLEVEAVTASECWDSSFSLTFASIDPIIVDPSRNQGEVSACPAGMGEASYAVDLSM